MSGREDNIEDRIINDVEANTGDDFSAEPSSDTDANQPNSSAEPTHSAEPSATQASERLRAERGKNNEGDKGAGKGKDKQGEREQPKFDAKGNQIGPDGNIIAAKGAERRLHSQNERLKEHNKSLTGTIAEKDYRIRQLEGMISAPRQAGLNDRDISQAFSIAAMMKRSPVEGARAALEFALSQGADLNQIVTGNGIQNISLGAQRRMMEEFHQRQFGNNQAQQHSQKVLRDASEQSLRFANAHPEAEEHFDDIARMIPEIIGRSAKQGRNIDAYTAAEMGLQMLQNFAMKNRLDPNRSIQSQINELRARQQNGGQQVPPRRDVRNPNSPRQAPMPNGSRGGRMTPSSSGSLPAGTSTDAIVRQAMAESGYRFDRN